MYNRFKHQFILSLSDRFNTDELEYISKQLDTISYDYDIKKKETAVIIYSSDLPEIAKTFLVCKKIEGLSEQTLYNYGLALKKFFITLQKVPEQITSNDVRVYLYKYQEQRKVSNRSLDKVRQTLSSFFHWASSEGYLQTNPMLAIKQIKYEIKPRIPLSQIELEYIRDVCRTPKERALVEFLYSTGCRISEVASMKKSDINWDTNTVKVFGKGSKHRVSYLNAKAEITLKKYLESRSDNNPYLFVSDRKPHNQMHKSGLEKIIRILSERSPLTKNFTPHTFRHTTATTAVNNGMNIQEVSSLLGHSHIATTMVYTHISNKNVQNNHEKYII